MAAAKNRGKKLPGRFRALVREMVPQAIQDEVQYQYSVEMIDQLMSSGKLTAGQALYMETLVQLVQVCEASHHAIETSRFTGLKLLRHLVADGELSASDLARMLGVHASMGSKILKGERALTVHHAKVLGERFKVRFDAFLAA